MNLQDLKIGQKIINKVYRNSLVYEFGIIQDIIGEEKINIVWDRETCIKQYPVDSVKDYIEGV